MMTPFAYIYYRIAVPDFTFLFRRMASANLGTVNLAVADRRIFKPSREAVGLSLEE